MNRRMIGTISTIALVLAGMTGCEKSGGADKPVSQATPAPTPTQSTPVPASPAPAPKIAVDASSPDRLLKSYWALQDALKAANQKMSVVQMPEVQQFKTVLTGVELAYIERLYQNTQVEVFEREIVEVKTETATRATALVTIRNVTPIPPEAEQSTFVMGEREKGKKFRYVMELVGDQWRVSEIYELKTYLSPPRWEKHVDLKPSVPFYVMP